jgi:hydrogenase expression/formation protein HypE
MKKNSHAVRAVLFDFDGTLTQPGSLDLSLIRRQIGCPAKTPILEFIASLPETEAQKAMARLDEFELNAAQYAALNTGAEEIICYLRAKGISIGILSRNTLASIERAFQNFSRIRVEDFNLMISRDDPVRHKPHPDGVLLAARQMNIAPAQMVVIGDYIFDVQAGKQAGAVTVFLDNGTSDFFDLECDYRVSSLVKFKDILHQNGGLL